MMVYLAAIVFQLSIGVAGLVEEKFLIDNLGYPGNWIIKRTSDLDGAPGEMAGDTFTVMRLDLPESPERVLSSAT